MADPQSPQFLQNLPAYERTRDFSKKSLRSLCYAPFTNLYFDRFGDVRICCSAAVVGNVRQHSMDEIWNGPKIAALRAALAAYDFPKGCEFCRFQTADGAFAGTRMKLFDRFEVTSSAPAWPKQMEFSISNACNLECIMCSGDYSSTIRAHREQRPPMPRVYSDEFIDGLSRYLPHLTQAKFLGGEPFLVAEHYRLWDHMIADGLRTPCHVTTNGTQYTRRVERVLELLPMGFSVSLDAATKPTYERIRVNAVFEEVMANARVFRDYARARKTSFSFTYCLMRQNWHELGEFCALADSWDVPTYINTVRKPPEFGVYTLPLDGLREVLAGLERQAVELESRLGRNKPVFFAELDRIRGKVRAGGGTRVGLPVV